MELLCEGISIPLAQLGPNFFISYQSVDAPLEHAVIRVSIDGAESRWAVRLPEGVRTGERTVYQVLSEDLNASLKPSAA